MRFTQTLFSGNTLGLQILIILLTCISCLSSSTELTQIQVPSVKDVYDEALELSANWRSDALLGFVQVKPSRNNTTPNNPLVIFSFESPANDGAYFVVSCQDVSCGGEEFIRPTDSDLTEALTLSNSMLDSEDAMKIAIANGGENYLDNPSSFGMLTLRLLNSDSDVSVWDVYFNDHLGLGSLHVIINATSGEILE